MGRLRGFLGFSFFFLVFVGTLWVLNLVPAFLELEGFRPFRNVHEAQAFLGESLLLPRYFPSELLWPPSEILVQRKPFRAYIVCFRKKRGDEKSLIFYRVPMGYPVPELHTMHVSVIGRVKTRIGHQEVDLVIGTAEGKNTCELSWVNLGMRWTLSGFLPPAELIKMAESVEIDE
jgi:hypothetical protein